MRSFVNLASGQVTISGYYLDGWLSADSCKPSKYITSTKVNSTFHPSGVGKLSTGLLRLRQGAVTCFGWQLDLWSHMACGALWWALHHFYLYLFVCGQLADITSAAVSVIFFAAFCDCFLTNIYVSDSYFVFSDLACWYCVLYKWLSYYYYYDRYIRFVTGCLHIRHHQLLVESLWRTKISIVWMMASSLTMLSLTSISSEFWPSSVVCYVVILLQLMWVVFERNGWLWIIILPIFCFSLQYWLLC